MLIICRMPLNLKYFISLLCIANLSSYTSFAMYNRQSAVHLPLAPVVAKKIHPKRQNKEEAKNIQASKDQQEAEAHQAYLNNQDCNGNTALMVGAKRGNKAGVRMLLE